MKRQSFSSWRLGNFGLDATEQATYESKRAALIAAGLDASWLETPAQSRVTAASAAAAAALATRRPSDSRKVNEVTSTESLMHRTVDNHCFEYVRRRKTVYPMSDDQWALISHICIDNAHAKTTWREHLDYLSKVIFVGRTWESSGGPKAGTLPVSVCGGPVPRCGLNCVVRQPNGGTSMLHFERTSLPWPCSHSGISDAAPEPTLARSAGSISIRCRSRRRRGRPVRFVAGSRDF